MATLVEYHGGAVMRWWVTPMPCLPVVMLVVASWALWSLIVVVLRVEVTVAVVVSCAPTQVPMVLVWLALVEVVAHIVSQASCARQCPHGSSPWWPA